MKKAFVRFIIIFFISTGLTNSSFSQDAIKGPVYEYFYLQHEYSGKYLCTGSTENGSNFFIWGPFIPSGHEPRYRFKRIAAGPSSFYFFNEFSGKYLCSGSLENGSPFHTWGPIPQGHESRYRFKMEATGKVGTVYLRHEYSGKYVCLGSKENGKNVHSWGPIPSGDESKYRFKLINAPGTEINNSPKVTANNPAVSNGSQIPVVSVSEDGEVIKQYPISNKKPQKNNGDIDMGSLQSPANAPLPTPPNAPDADIAMWLTGVNAYLNAAITGRLSGDPKSLQNIRKAEAKYRNEPYKLINLTIGLNF